MNSIEIDTILDSRKRGIGKKDLLKGNGFNIKMIGWLNAFNSAKCDSEEKGEELNECFIKDDQNNRKRTHFWSPNSDENIFYSRIIGNDEGIGRDTLKHYYEGKFIRCVKYQ